MAHETVSTLPDVLSISSRQAVTPWICAWRVNRSRYGMSLVIAVAAGSVLVLAVGVWAWVSREGVHSDRDMGTISGQWINEHRSQERQSNDR